MDLFIFASAAVINLAICFYLLRYAMRLHGIMRKMVDAWGGWSGDNARSLQLWLTRTEYMMLREIYLANHNPRTCELCRLEAEGDTTDNEEGFTN